VTEHECEYELVKGKCGEPARNFLPCQFTPPFVTGTDDEPLEPQLLKIWLCPKHAEDYEGVV
jgi:hypothetical protein